MTKLKELLSGIDKKKVATSAAVFAVIFGGVAIAHRIPALSQFLDVPGANTATAAVSHTAKAAPVKSEPVEGLMVNINTADAVTLTLLPGIGASRADAIIAYREAHGLFYRIEDIMDVKGIGRAMFEGMKDSISVGDVTPPPIEPASSVAASPSNESAHSATALPAKLIISAVSPELEYVELYNAGDSEADLSGWSVKKISSTGKAATLVSAARLRGKVIPPAKHFLIAQEGYTGPSLPDALWPSSYSLAAKNNGLQLYREKEPVDSVAWTDIPKEKSYVRTSPESAQFVVAEPAPRNSLN